MSYAVSCGSVLSVDNYPLGVVRAVLWSVLSEDKYPLGVVRAVLWSVLSVDDSVFDVAQGRGPDRPRAIASQPIGRPGLSWLACGGTPARQQWSVRHGGGAAVTYSHRADRLRRLLTADVTRVGLRRG